MLFFMRSELPLDAYHAGISNAETDKVRDADVSVDRDVGVDEVGYAARRQWPRAEIRSDATAKAKTPVPVEIAQETGKGRKGVQAEVHGRHRAEVEHKAGVAEACLGRRAESQGHGLGDIPSRENVFGAASYPETVIAEKRSRVDDELSLIRMGKGCRFRSFGKGEDAHETENRRERRRFLHVALLYCMPVGLSKASYASKPNFTAS